MFKVFITDKQRYKEVQTSGFLTVLPAPPAAAALLTLAAALDSSSLRRSRQKKNSLDRSQGTTSRMTPFSFMRTGVSWRSAKCTAT